jgi:iron complex outermembrane receptor protein
VEGELNLAVGSKFLHQSYAGFELQPSAGLIWTPGLTHTVWSAVTRAVRTPSRVEADLEITSFLGASPLTYLRLQGNSDFSSEKLLGYEVGYRGGFREGLAVELAAFLNSYDRLLSLEPGQPFTEDTPPPSHEVVPFLLGNGLRGTTTGIELAADWLARPWWRLKTSYAYLNMALEAREGSLDTSTAASTEGSSPRHSVALRSFVRLPGGIEFDQFYRVVDALPSQGVDAYQEVDARLGRRVGSNLEVSLVGQNLLRPRHPEFSGGSAGVEIRRSVYGRLNFTW